MQTLMELSETSMCKKVAIFLLYLNLEKNSFEGQNHSKII